MPVVIPMPQPKDYGSAQRKWLEQLEASVVAQIATLEVQLELIRAIKNAPPTGGDPATGR